MCFFSPIRNDPKKKKKNSHKQLFGTPPVPGQSRKFVHVYVFFLSLKTCTNSECTEHRGTRCTGPTWTKLVPTWRSTDFAKLLVILLCLERPKTEHNLHFLKSSSSPRDIPAKIPKYHCTQKITKLIPKQFRFGNSSIRITEHKSQNNSVRDSVILCSHLLPRPSNSRNNSVR